MTEEKQKKKKPGIFRRILKWIGLGILIIFFLAAVFFQAPWKVTILLLVILLACTALPKPARKWFWLSAGAVVIALIVWVFLPDENGDWRPYRFEKELAALEAKYKIPDEQNAAVIYNQLLEKYDSNDFEPNLSDPNIYRITRSQFWKDDEYPEVLKWLKGHEDTIQTLMEVAKREKCWFRNKPDILHVGENMERLSAFRKWAYLLLQSANNDIGQSRVENALEKYLSLLRISCHLRQQATLVDYLVSLSIETLAEKQLNKFIVTENVKKEHTEQIEKALQNAEHIWSKDFSRFLGYDKLLMKSLFAMMYETNSKGDVRLALNLYKTLSANQPEEIKQSFLRGYWKRKTLKAAGIFHWFYMPSTPQKAGKIIDSAYKKLHAMAKPDFDWSKVASPPSKIPELNIQYMVRLMTQIIKPAYYRIHELHLKTIAEQRGCQIIIALRRYKDKNGDWPESLDDIKPDAPAEIFVDPTNSGEFVYKLTEENFTLYSRGKNNIDEDGHYNSTWDPNSCERKVEADDRPIWPPKNYKTEEKPADDEQQ